jgi:mRNA interferase HicA
VKGSDFIDRVTRIGRERGVPVRIDTERGKGSHITLYYGDRFAIVKDRRKEIPPGLLSAMIRQLGLAQSDIR